MSKIIVTTNLPANFYVDERVFADERDHLFATAWQYLGPASRVAEPGSYVSQTVAGIRILVIRSRDGVLRGFRNSCRHRGAPILEDGHGRCPRRLRCPYHLWTYDDTGQLTETPWFGDSDNFDPADWPLETIAVDAWRGLLFAAVEPRESLTEQLGETVTELVDVPIDGYVHEHDAFLEFDANWKIYTDNFVEGYHIPGIHPQFFAAIDFDKFSTTARNGIVCMTAPTGDDLFYQGRWYWMWPNWTLSLYPDGMSTSRINPTSAGHTELHYSFYFSPGSKSTPPDRQATIERNLDVIREDFGICLGVHQNYLNGNYTPGPLSDHHEQGVAWFQKRLRERVYSREKQIPAS